MFVHLPVDIKLVIFSFLPPEDILHLKQTCRVLHTLGCQDYVWHQLQTRIDYPLDLPLHRDVTTLNSSEIQAIVMKALQLEQNWHGHPGRPRQMYRTQPDIRDSAVVTQIQPLGSEWVMTLWRTRIASFHLYILSLKERRYYHVVETQVPLKFSATLQSQSKGMIATIGLPGGIRAEPLNIYSISLSQKPSGACVSHLCESVSRENMEGAFVDVQVCGDLVAGAIARFQDELSWPLYGILLINTSTNVQWSFLSETPLDFERFRFRLFTNSIVIVGVKRCDLAVSIYTLPPSILRKCADGSMSPSLDSDNLAILVSRYEATGLPHGFSFHIPLSQGRVELKELSVIVFPDLHHSDGEGYISTFPLGHQSWATEPRALITRPFKFSPKASADNVYIGATGRQAVWIQRKWDTDDYDLMRGSFPREGPPKIQPLLPQFMATPFQVPSCNCLGFNEASGHVYFGPDTGGLYVLEFC